MNTRNRIVWMGIVVVALSSISLAQGQKKKAAGSLKSWARINGHQAEEQITVSSDKKTWSFGYERGFTKDPSAWMKQDVVKTDMRWKNYKPDTTTTDYRNGLYGTYVLFKFEFKRPFTSLNAKALLGNYADRFERRACLEYSLDNQRFHSFGDVEYRAGRSKLEGVVTFQKAPAYAIWVRARQEITGDRATDGNTLSGHVVLHSIAFKFEGPTKMSPVKHANPKDGEKEQP